MAHGISLIIATSHCYLCVVSLKFAPGLECDNVYATHCQVVAYGRVKTKKKSQTFFSKSGRGRLQEGPSIVICTGRLREVVAYER